ncbi:MAG: AAA family ATPase [Desulfonatronovibrionaceae bacterium]
MEYYTLLDLKREPFSNSPDPECFYPTAQHTFCLQQLEIAIRLRRGLNILLGEVGTGKTTLCRQLVRKLDQAKTRLGLILDPGVDSESEFLALLHRELGSEWEPEGASPQEARESLHSFVFDRVNNHGELIVLLLDEGQRIAESNLELLRQLLNFEANAEKYLQIVIFAQPEFERGLKAKRNLLDRVNFYYRLTPMSFSEIKGMIRHRLQECAESGKRPPEFSLPALWAIHRLSRGYPRQLLHLCHHLLLGLIVSGKRRVGLTDVLAHRFGSLSGLFRPRAGAFLWLATLFVGGAALWAVFWGPGPLTFGLEEKDPEHGVVFWPEQDPGNRVPAKEGPARQQNSREAAVLAPEPLPENGSGSGDNGSGSPLTPEYGVVEVPQGHNLWLMAARIYGITDENRLQQEIFPEIRRLNPELGLLETLTVGQKIKFPFLERFFRSRPGGYHINFLRTVSLDRAMQSLISSAPVKKRLWYRQTEREYEFFVLSRMGFSSPDAARAYLNSSLGPDEAQGGAKIMSFDRGPAREDAENLQQ